MIARWCISVFVVLLTLFGAVSQQQVAVPNQEIVLQFTDVELTSEDAKQTISIVKAQLEAFGVENIQIKITDNAKLKISYYCETDISSIKKIFAGENNLTLNYQNTSQDKDTSRSPSNDTNIIYNLDVYEIQSASDSGWDLDGTFTLEVEVKSDRFLDPNVFFSPVNLDFRNTNSIVKVVLTCSHKVPKFFVSSIVEELRFLKIIIIVFFNVLLIKGLGNFEFQMKVKFDYFLKIVYRFKLC